MFCAALTTKGTECKHGITSGCTVEVEGYTYYLCQQHYRQLTLVVSGTVVEYLGKLSNTRKTPTMTHVVVETKETKNIRFFCIHNWGMYGGVKKYFFNSVETINVNAWSEVIDYAMSMVEGNKCFIAQWGGRSFGIRLDGSFKEMDGEFVITKNRFIKK